MRQYYDIKKEYPDILLLFRMGDFYELFFEDAKDASRLLNIALTCRGKLGDFSIPMAGIPFHAASTYVDKITNQGLKAAICEQIEDPSLAKGLVKRAVTQVVSPAMPYDIEKIQGIDYRFLGSASLKDKKFYLTLIDYTTGAFIGHILESFQEFFEKVQLYAPCEFLSFFDQWETYPELKNYLEQKEVPHTYLSQEYFSPKFTTHYIEKLIPNHKTDKILKESSPFLESIGAISYYIHSTQGEENSRHIKPLKIIPHQQEMKVSYTTLCGLEIFPQNKENYRKSLLGFMDKTCSSLGARKLKEIFLTPTRDLLTIEKRQTYIKKLLHHQETLETQRVQIKDMRDIERIMAKVNNKKANSHDLLTLGKSLSLGRKIYQELPFSSKALPQINQEQQDILEKLSKQIENTLNHEIGASLDKGNLINEGFHSQRDKLASLSENSSETLLQLEKRYREKTGIPNLKIKSNNVAGFFIEVSKSYIDKVPDSFRRRQTLTNAERYTTEELDSLEKEILSSKEKLFQLEKSIFLELLQEIQIQAMAISICGDLIASMDALQSLAWAAYQNNFSCPKMNSNKTLMDVQGAFHPLIKKELGEDFISHNLRLDSHISFGLITGPNMAGKTTVMREMAIIQFLAQIGSFVPAQKAELGLCDYLFSRLGASDDILRGQSTFMLEMSETAEILRHASPRSLIVLDEIGRGTSTYDGLSIAWALVEYISSKVQALTLFSTHYHELIDLVEGLPNAKNLTVKTHREGKKVTFLYELIEGGATQSFGIHVAALAGLPSSVLKRSEIMLKKLEYKESNLLESLPPIQEESSLEKQLRSLEVNNLTPIDALNLLNQWKKEI